MFRRLMFKNSKVVFLVLIIAIVAIYAPVTQSASNLVEQLIKIFGIGYIIDRFSEPINDFINTLTINNGVEVKEKTKVVPIITIGSGTYAGFVQVSGPAEAIKEVEAVAQLEGNFSEGAFRIRALIPINTKNPADFKNIQRIEGVGITGLVDINI